MRFAAVVLWLAVIAGAAGAVSHVQGSARGELEARFGLRATEGAKFAQFYIETVFSQQRMQADRLLSAATSSEDRFELVTLSLGYPAAVLLDDHGRVLNVAPADPAVIGRYLAANYQHLRQAVAGNNAISAVVHSAVTGLPIVAFAVPFDTPAGRRVFSGGFDASKTPLATFLKNGVDIKPGEAYLIDADSGIVATSAPSVSPGQTLRSQNPALADALDRRPAGLVRTGATSTYFTTAAVAGTSWRIVLAMPTAELYAPVSGDWMAVARLLVAALAVGGLAIVVFVVRMSDAARARRRTLALLEANAEQLAAARDEAFDGFRRLAEAQRLVHLGRWEWDIAGDTVTWSEELYRIFGCEPDEFEPSYDQFLARLHQDDRQMVDDAVGRGGRLRRPGGPDLFNRASQELHGLPATATTPEEWAGRYGLYRTDGVTLMEPDDIPLLQALRGEQVHVVEMVIRPVGGQPRVVWVNAQAIHDGAGNMLGAVAALHDVTERKRAESALASLNADLERRVRERTAEAERANEAKSEFVSRMSHCAPPSTPCSASPSSWPWTSWPRTRPPGWSTS